jgi:hypothetical protein
MARLFQAEVWFEKGRPMTKAVIFATTVCALSVAAFGCAAPAGDESDPAATEGANESTASSTEALSAGCSVRYVSAPRRECANPSTNTLCRTVVNSSLAGACTIADCNEVLRPRLPAGYFVRSFSRLADGTFRCVGWYRL